MNVSENNNAPKNKKLPKTSWHGRLKAKMRRTLINTFNKKPGPKDLADNVFIDKIKKFSNQTTLRIKKLEKSIDDWQGAFDRYKAIAEYLDDLPKQEMQASKPLEDMGKGFAGLQELQEKILLAIQNKQTEEIETKIAEIEKIIIKIKNKELTIEKAIETINLHTEENATEKKEEAEKNKENIEKKKE